MPLFERMRELFEILNARRRRLGSIDFDFDEAEVVLDEDGQVEAIVASERNVAHRLIEEFMLLANETVAEFLDTSAVPGPVPRARAARPAEGGEVRGVRREPRPQPGRAAAHGPAAPLPGAARSRSSGTPEERPIAVLMLRTMQKARYAPANLGHFGLAFSSYTHFTSPIRRYPDLVVHRLLRAARRGAS